MNTLFFFLDDVRNPPEDGNQWILARSVPELKRSILDRVDTGEMISAEKIVFSLDHDLGEGQETGYDYLKTIEFTVAQMGPPDNQEMEFRIHSANPVGRENMERAIASINRLIAVSRNDPFFRT